MAELLKDRDEHVREAALQTLGELGHGRPLKVLLKDQDPQVRRAAAEALARPAAAGSMLPSPFYTRPSQPGDSRDLLTEKGPGRIRVTAVMGFVGGGPQAEQYIPDLAKLLKDENAAVRRATACTLAGLGLAGAELAVPTLCELLTDKNADIRREAASTLGGIDGQADPAIPVLLELESTRSGASGMTRPRPSPAWVPRRRRPSPRRGIASRQRSNRSVRRRWRPGLLWGPQQRPRPGLLAEHLPTRTKWFAGIPLRPWEAWDLSAGGRRAAGAIARGPGSRTSDRRRFCLEKIGPAARQAIPALTALLRTRTRRSVGPRRRRWFTWAPRRRWPFPP